MMMSPHDIGRTARRPVGVMIMAAVVAATVGRPVEGVAVTAKVSSREVLPGEVFQLEIEVEGDASVSAPELPTTPDFQIALVTPNPSRSSFTQIINGRITSRTTLTYVYEVRARRAGRLTIPAIGVKIGGKVYKTAPITIVAVKSETGDLLFVEFAADRESVYVEQPFELTLRIWVRPFRQGDVKLNGNQMWGLLKRGSAFGPFAKQAATNKFQVRRALRKDRQGQEHEYYLYQARQKVRPDKPGPYRPEPVSINMNYPVRLRRSVFGDLRMERGRRLAEQARPPDIVVKAVPDEGRPPTYNGAIGRYTWKVWADRTDVRRGQLITLNMEIGGEGLLERVPAPPLAKVPELAKGFKVLDEQLAGEVKEGKKVYRQKIRATDEDVEAIPPIPFVFFDPDADQGKGRFVTVKSEPIPVTVHAAESLSPDEIVVPAAIGSVQSSLLTEAADSIRANYAEADAVLASQVFAPGPGWAVSVALPPVVWLVGWLLRRRSDRLRTDVALSRRRGARRSAEQRLGSARTSADPAGQVAEALLNYVADRANLPAGGLTRTDAVNQIRDDGAPDETIEGVNQLLAACEAARYAGVAASNDTLMTQAEQCLRQLERTWKP